MIAVGGFHDAGVTSLAVSIEAPVVECINHLAGIDILVQAAVGVGTGISGVGVGQLGKAFLGCIAGLPLIQQVLGLFTGSFFCSIGVGAVLVLVAIEADKNMANIDHLNIIVIHTIVQNHIESGDSFQIIVIFVLHGAGNFHAGNITGLAGAIGNPAAQVGVDGAAGLIGVDGSRSLGALVDVHGSNGCIQLVQRSGLGQRCDGFLGSRHSFGTLCGSIGGGAILRSGALRQILCHRDVVLSVAIGGILGGILAVSLTNLLLGVS